jgi:hypothetical protein
MKFRRETVSISRVVNNIFSHVFQNELKARRMLLLGVAFGTRLSSRIPK